MSKSTGVLIKFIVFIVFLFFYFQYLIIKYFLPNEYLTNYSWIIFLGFTLIIFSIFIFIFINHKKKEYRYIKIRNFPENLVKIILLLLIFVSVFFPPVSFSSLIMDWNQITILNYFRAVLMFIGVSFLPGASLYSLLFPQNSLKNSFNTGNLFLKITLYPFLSIIFIGISVLILDQLGLDNMANFTIILFFLILLLFCIDFLSQILRSKEIKFEIFFNFKFSQVKYSKYKSILLINAFGIIIIALGVAISTQYSIPGDTWKAIHFANYISDTNYNIINRGVNLTSPIFWGYITFGMSALCGIPFVNINIMMVVFSYLFLNSLYFFIKSILYKYKEEYTILSVILITVFSGLYIFYTSDFKYMESNLGNISWLLFSGEIYFLYKSFAYQLVFMALGIFFLHTMKPREDIINDSLESKISKNKSNLTRIFIVGLFLILSYMIYMLPIIMALYLIFLYYLIYEKNLENLRTITILLFIIFIIYIIFDILMNFFLSFIAFNKIIYFFLPISQNVSIIDRVIISYSLMFVILCIIYLIYSFKLKSKNKKTGFVLAKLDYKKEKFGIQLISIIILSILLILFIFEISIWALNKSSLDYLSKSIFVYFLDIIFLNIGFIGILSIFLSFLMFNFNRRLYFFLITWIIISLTFAFLVIFQKTVLSNNFGSIEEISKSDFDTMNYWYNRIWYNAIPAFAILCSIGLINLGKRFNVYKIHNEFNRFRAKLISSFKFLFTSFFIFLSLSNLIISGIYWASPSWKLENEQARLVGWLSENDIMYSSILTPDMSYTFRRALIDLAKCRVRFFDEFIDFLDTIPFNIEANEYAPGSIRIIEKFGNHEKVLEFSDEYVDQFVYLSLKEKTPQNNGTIEFFLRTNDPYKAFRLTIDNSYKTLIYFEITNGAVYIIDGNVSVFIKQIQPNYWYNVKIDLECSNNSFEGLNQYTWQILINDTFFTNLSFLNNEDLFTNLKLYSSYTSLGLKVYIDSLNYSWIDQSSIEDNFFKFQNFTNNLKVGNIKYLLIHQFDINYLNPFLKWEIQNYFSELIYHYKDLYMYYAPNF